MNIVFFILLGILKGSTPGDDPVWYARMTNTWSYLSNDRVTVTEYWFTRDKSCTVVNSMNKTIIREDKGIRYYVNLRSGSVQSSTIQQYDKTTPVEPVQKVEDIKHVGQHYTPFFEWKPPVLLAKEKYAGYDCDHFTSYGDADFARISLDFILAEAQDQFVADFINSFMLSTREPNKREPVNLMVKNNSRLFPVKLTEDVENAISPHIVTTLVIDKLERVTPSEGLFEPPAN